MKNLKKMEAVNCTGLELSTYLQGLEAGYLPTCSLDMSQSERLKSIPIASKSYRDGKKTVTFHGFPSLMMLPNSMEGGSRDSSTLSPAGSLSPARISHVQEKAKVLRVQDLDFGEKWRELSMRYDRDTSSWKTHRSLWAEALPTSSVILPKYGMMRNGVVYQRRTSERPIEGTGSGWLPTPTVQDGNGRTHHNQRDGSKTDSLLGVVQKFPTPTKSDGTGGPGRSDKRTGGDNLRTHIGGTLNPDWTELLLGWPMGWSDLKPLDHIDVNWYTWSTDWERDTPRVTIVKTNRANRLKAIGNGQVPIVAATAWKILSKIGDEPERG